MWYFLFLTFSFHLVISKYILLRFAKRKLKKNDSLVFVFINMPAMALWRDVKSARIFLITIK